MTMPDPRAASSPARADATTSPLLRAAIWVAIGALIAAAIVCVVWVLTGSQNGIVGRAFLTILLLVAFAGVAILDAHLAPRRPAWFALASMASWVIALLIGAVLIWMPERYPWGGFTRFIQFLLIVLILQLALLHLRLYLKAFRRYVTAFTQTVGDHHDRPRRRPRRAADRSPRRRGVRRLQRPLLADRGRRRHPRRGRHGADPARECAVRAEEGARGSGLRCARTASLLAAGAAALADLRRRRDAAADPSGRLARLERVLHRHPVAGCARRRRTAAARRRRCRRSRSPRRIAAEPAQPGYEGYPPPPPLPPRP